MDLLQRFYAIYGAQPTLRGRAPGRVNLLGEHVDYNNGPVLPAAIDREVQLVAAPSNDDFVSLAALDLQEVGAPPVTFDPRHALARLDIHGQPLPGWALYPAGVAWALQNAGLSVGGLQVAYTSQVPIGAGLSSSAAVEVGFAILWRLLGGWEQDGLSLAILCQKAENDYIGVKSGLMDQFASANGVAGHALYFDTQSLAWEPVPLPANTSLVIADSGLRRQLTTSAYNERRAACEQAVAELRRFLPNLNSLRDVQPAEFAAYGEYLDPLIRRRAEHVVHEIARVEFARSALLRQDTQTMGALMYAGHSSLRDLYEVSLPELDTLVELAHQQPGCIGARLTGAGFGGCTINLVENLYVEEFIAHLQEGYFEKTGHTATVYACQASNGAQAMVV